MRVWDTFRPVYNPFFPVLNQILPVHDLENSRENFHYQRHKEKNFGNIDGKNFAH